MYKITSSFPERVITLKEAKDFLKVSYSEDDGLIKNCVFTALETAGHFLNCYLYARNIGWVTEVSQQEVRMPAIPIQSIRSVTIANKGMKNLCKISADRTSIILPKETKDEVAFAYQTEPSPLAPPLKHILMNHMEALYEKRILSPEEQKQILNLYKPYRKILV